MYCAKADVVFEHWRALPLLRTWLVVASSMLAFAQIVASTLERTPVSGIASMKACSSVFLNCGTFTCSFCSASVWASPTSYVPEEPDLRSVAMKAY